METNTKQSELPYRQMGVDIGRDHQECPIHGGSDSFACKKKRDGTIVWKCFNENCNPHDINGGTIVDLLMAKGQASTPGEAFQVLQDQYGLDTGDFNDSNVRTKRIERSTMHPNPVREAHDLTPPKSYIHPKKGRKSKIKTKVDGDYIELRLKDADLETMVCAKYHDDIRGICTKRWDITDEKGQPHKVIRPFSTDREGYWRKGITVDQRPLYRLKELDQRPNERVIFVEGEKCLDRVEQEIVDILMEDPSFPGDFITTTLIGGTSAVNKTDLSPLDGREIHVFPDCDEPGRELVDKLTQQVEAEFHVHWLKDDLEETGGYDIADWIDEGRSLQHAFDKETEVLSTRDPVEELEERAEQAEMDEVIEILEDLHDANLRRIQEERILKEIKSSTGYTLGTLRDEYEDIQMGDAEVQDWPDRIAEMAIEERFDNQVISEGGVTWWFDGRKWIPCKDQHALKHDILLTAKKYLPPDEDLIQTMRKAYQAFLAKTSRVETQIDMVQQPAPIINCENVQVKIEDEGQITTQNHDPDEFLTYCMDVNYDSDASCPTYDQMVRDTFCGHEEMIEFWHEVCGYLIQPVRDLKHYFLLHGSGHNGKTTMMDIISKLCSGAVARKDINTIEKRFGKWSLVDKLLLIDDDVSPNTKLPEGTLKKLSENKTVEIEPKNKEAFQATLNVACVMLCNHWPSTGDMTRANISRAITIPFEAHFTPEERDDSLKQEVIANELPGVLNRCLEGLRRLRERGHFDIPQKVSEYKKEWLKNANSLYAFISTMFVEQDDETIYGKELYKEYRLWCKKQGIDRYRLKKGSVKRKLESIDEYRVESANNNKGGWKVIGVSWSNDSN